MKNNENNLYCLLKSKKIIEILDGDNKYGKYEFEDGSSIHISMPYLSGPDLCAVSTLFGLTQTYSQSGKNLSRWQYFDNLLSYCLKENKTAELLAHLFSKKQFSKMLSNKSVAEFEKAYSHIKQTIIEKINGLLYYGGHELTIIANIFVVRKIGNKVEIQTPKLKNIDREYIKSISSRANEDIEQKNYDSALTKCRTLLEEVFCYVIEKKGEVPLANGDIAKLFRQVKDLYNMHTDKNADKRINTLLSGLNSIVSSIAEMRNSESDSHGVGEKRIKIDEHHARLFVNTSISMADFILSVENKVNDAI